MAILFYLKRDSYGWLSNFSPHGIEMKGLAWPTVEHYYQAQKVAGTDYEELIRHAHNPSTAKAMANDGTRPVRPDWEAVRYGIMQAAVLKKFETHKDLREFLLATGDEILVEESPTDYYWGCGADGTGQNNLGKILIEVRALLRVRVEQTSAADRERKVERGEQNERKGDSEKS